MFHHRRRRENGFGDVPNPFHPLYTCPGGRCQGRWLNVSKLYLRNTLLWEGRCERDKTDGTGFSTLFTDITHRERFKIKSLHHKGHQEHKVPLRRSNSLKSKAKDRAYLAFSSFFFVVKGLDRSLPCVTSVSNLSYTSRAQRRSFGEGVRIQVCQWFRHLHLP